MFDIGFTELLVIAVVAFVVLGPERLPKVARTLGHLFGRAQRYVSEVKAEINREMALDELHKAQARMEQAARDVQYTMTDEVKKTETAIQEAVDAGTHEKTESPVADAASPQLELGLDTQSTPSSEQKSV